MEYIHYVCKEHLFSDPETNNICFLTLSTHSQEALVSNYKLYILDFDESL